MLCYISVLYACSVIESKIHDELSESELLKIGIAFCYALYTNNLFLTRFSIDIFMLFVRAVLDKRFLALQRTLIEQYIFDK